MTVMKRVLLGVTGSIAAFKAASLASDLVKDGYDVRAILSSGARHFIAPLTFAALTGQPVIDDTWQEDSDDQGIVHIDAAHWADALVVAPASANALARLALGLVNDSLSAVALATRAPILLAPAMESGMWEHAATQEHIRTLVERGAVIVGPAEGRLASGGIGKGRMAEPSEIVSALRNMANKKQSLQGHRVLVSAGPTYEPIDPVRFLGNRSSGKMGYAIAIEAEARGADVTIVSGPTDLAPPANVEVIRVESARDMQQALMRQVDECSVVVMAAAIADYTPESVAEHKLKRHEILDLCLVPTEDVAAALSRAAPAAVHVGFALESEDLIGGARRKLADKHQQLVVANRIDECHNPFGSDVNTVSLITRESVQELASMTKREVASRVWDTIEELLAQRPPQD